MSGALTTAPFAENAGVSERNQAPRQIVYVIDDNVDVRKSLHFALEASGITVWPFGGPQDFLDQIEMLKPAPILLDVRMPKIDGLQLLQMIRDRAIDWPVIMMTAHGEIQIAVAAMKLRAFDFLEKPFAIERLEGLLAVAYSELEKTVENSSRRVRADSKFASLSPREKEVARGLALGKTSKMIASELGISHRTVEIHRAAVLTKLQAKSTACAVRLLVEGGQA